MDEGFLYSVCMVFIACHKSHTPQAFLHHPTVKAAEENREVIIEGMLKSLKTLSLLADGEDPFTEMGKPHPGDLVTSFSNFEVIEGQHMVVKWGHMTASLMSCDRHDVM